YADFFATVNAAEKRPGRTLLKSRHSRRGVCGRVVSLSHPPRGITNTRVRAIGQQSRPIVRRGRHVIASRRRPACVPRHPSASRGPSILGPRPPTNRQESGERFGRAITTCPKVRPTLPIS